MCSGSPAFEPTAACFIGVLGHTYSHMAVSDEGGMLGTLMAVHVHGHEPLSSMFPVPAIWTGRRGSSVTVVSQKLCGVLDVSRECV